MSHDPQAELVKIQQAIAAQEALRGIVPDEQLETTLATLRQTETSLQAQISGTGAIAQGQDAAAATATTGGTAIAKVQGNVYIGPQPQNPAEALAIYRQVLLQTRGHLPMRGIDVGSSDPTTGQKPLSLVHVYVDLNTTSQVILVEKLTA